jgi:putative endonuclease
MTEPGGWVYMMINRPRGTLYTGITADLIRRVSEHKSGTGSTFTRRYYLKTLVWLEHHHDITAAIQRETNIKRWPRQWKLELIEKDNPAWDDLYLRLVTA